MAARAATAGFHFLWLDLERSPLTLETVHHIVLATRDLPAMPVARVPVTETWMAERVLFLGTGDPSFSLRGNQDDPRVEAAEAQVVAAARRHGKIAGRPAGSPERTQRLIEQGFLFFQAPSELALFETGAQQFLGPHGIRPARRQRTLY